MLLLLSTTQAVDRQYIHIQYIVYWYDVTWLTSSVHVPPPFTDLSRSRWRAVNDVRRAQMFVSRQSSLDHRC